MGGLCPILSRPYNNDKAFKALYEGKDPEKWARSTSDSSIDRYIYTIL